MKEEEEERQLWSRREKYGQGYFKIEGNGDAREKRSASKKGN